ncbi:hypothetical protein [Enterococcus faecium]|uniref:Uncharacterized protein n=1 Tax=Enterococcus faecium TaxID=1352 RepID=A0A242AZY9_ENTFC|nr:hypothetical protein [Enterococcus faecium]OTN86623.1 hypothetical protein A5810_003021 [Enterococcus faecium]
MVSRNVRNALRQVMNCCKKFQQIIVYFGDNPTIFFQTNEYICAVIGQCMYLRELVRFVLPNSWKKVHQEIIWTRTICMCNKCAHPNQLNLYHLWLFIKSDIPVLYLFCQEYLEAEKKLD